jgi:hypothetical protein
MARNPTPDRKGVRPGMRKMVVQIPEEIFKTLKIRSVEQDTTMKDLVTEALRRSLGIREGGESRKK